MKQTQTDKLHNLLLDHRPHRTDEIARVVYGEKGSICPHCGRGEVKSLARVGARIHDIKHKKLSPGWTIKGWHDPENPALYYYQLVRTEPVEFRQTSLLNRHA